MRTRPRKRRGKAKPASADEKLWRIVDAYLSEPNGTKAAIAAGYSERTAAQQASRMLRNVKVQEALAKSREKLAERSQVTAERTMRELAYVGYSDIGQIIDFDGNQLKLKPASSIPEAARRSIASVKVKRYVEGRGEVKRPRLVPVSDTYPPTRRVRCQPRPRAPRRGRTIAGLAR
jgi:phage terminase small subunit